MPKNIKQRLYVCLSVLGFFIVYFLLISTFVASEVAEATADLDYLSTVFENHRKSLILRAKRATFTKVN